MIENNHVRRWIKIEKLFDSASWQTFEYKICFFQFLNKNYISTKFNLIQRLKKTNLMFENNLMLNNFSNQFSDKLIYHLIDFTLTDLLELI